MLKSTEKLYSNNHFLSFLGINIKLIINLYFLRYTSVLQKLGQYFLVFSLLASLPFSKNFPGGGDSFGENGLFHLNLSTALFVMVRGHD